MTSTPRRDRRPLHFADPMRHGPDERGRTPHASPLLIYIACVLALLLAILQVDLNRSSLERLGFAPREMTIELASIHP